MSTTIHPDISKKNPYWIEKHRYYELKHFCLQYPIWKKAYESLNGLSKRPVDLERFERNGISDPTANCAVAMIFYRERLDMIEKAALETDSELARYLLIGVTEGLSYDILRAKHNIPCCRNTYYELYRKFFWMLNKIRK